MKRARSHKTWALGLGPWAFTAFFSTITFAQNWPSFRGPNASGVADGHPAPVKWNATSGDGVLWKTPIPGVAVSSPIVWADRVFVYQSPDVKWDVASAVAPLGRVATVEADLARLTDAIVSESRPGDHLVLMSNGSFGGLHDRLLAALEARRRR